MTRGGRWHDVSMPCGGAILLVNDVEKCLVCEELDGRCDSGQLHSEGVGNASLPEGASARSTQKRSVHPSTAQRTPVRNRCFGWCWSWGVSFALVS